MRPLSALVVLVVTAGCKTTPKSDMTPPAEAPSTSGSNSVAAAPPSAARVVNQPCGTLKCTNHESASDAFAEVLKTKPLVLAIGESHAQRKSAASRSTTARFTQELLPKLKGVASDVVLEVWFGNPKCKKAVAKVAKQQKAVTKHQAKKTKSEHVILGDRAKALGIRPHALEPSCEQYDAIAKAGASDVAMMLSTVADLTVGLVDRILKRNAKNQDDRMVLAYGGLLHNDGQPKTGREAWAFGPRLRKRTDGRYVALDLISREAVTASATWKSLEWFDQIDLSHAPDQALLVTVRPDELVLILPRQRRAAPQPSASTGSPP